MIEINLPRLVGSRLDAQRLVAEQLAAMRDDRVVLNCRNLLSASPSFADEVVKQVLVDGGAAELVILAAGDDFVDYVQRSAGAHGVEGRVVVLPAGSEVEA